MPAPKTLEEHCRDRTFRSRRHHELLAGPALPWPVLAGLQGRYAAAASMLERRAVGVEFERTVGQLEDDVLTGPHPGRSVLEEIIAMGPIEYDPVADRRATERANRAVWARDLYRDGLTLSAIAERIGVASSTVRRYLAERGELAR